MVLRYLVALVSLLTIFIISAQAQSIEPDAINPAGGSAVSGGQEFEYSIGQLIPSTIQSPHTPGVLQPSWVVTGVEGPVSASLKVRVYPDPMETVLFLQPELDAPGSLRCTLYDASGKTVFRRDIRLTNGRELQEINVSALATGNYVLELTSTNVQGRPEKASFKLQKLR